MFSFLFLGFSLGAAHAFEADHVAAVSSLVAGRLSRRAMLKSGLMWGFGHTLSLLGVCTLALLSGRIIGPHLNSGLELGVGLMLVALGGHVLYRLRRDRVHFHRHAHKDGTTHLHLHSHLGESGPHQRAAHRHAHPDGAVRRSLFVGMMHGLAGSSALLVATAAAFDSAISGFFFVLLFGAGSILGMGAMSAVLSVPLSLTAGLLTRANTVLQVSIGCLTMAIGARIILINAGALLL
ncbi:MAG: hypothetical protein ACE5DK_02905 [Paracoccaceae bacterium]